MNSLFYIIYTLVLLNQVNNASKVDYVKNDCNRCKVLTDSFNYWLDKTSRGKFEGGDAAWEETKLRSYARSEIRLVEIQENLCSEVTKEQNHCYSLNEEVELILESWWALEKSTSIDLHTWLCTEKLKYCCPKNHYGELCQPCPFKNNKICNGHGKCHGEGTRGGNGTCLCVKGYKGLNCDECDDNFFIFDTDTCKPCHQGCIGCKSEGPSACFECALGWTLESGVCIDLNECNNPSVCKSNQFCVNKEGSYTCMPCHKTCNSCEGVGYANCSSCDSGKVLIAGQCISKLQLQQTLFNAGVRIFIYFLLLIISAYILKKSKTLATLVVTGIAIFGYYLEQRYEINTKDVIFNYYSLVS